MIRSVNDDQHQIIRDIMSLEDIERFDLDPTYSKGQFYKGIPEPVTRMDIEPRYPVVQKADVRNLPLPSESQESIMFDPPFIAGGAGASTMAQRFSSFKTVKHMWRFLEESMTELTRVLAPQGTLVVKCQDLINGRTQYLTHYELITYALERGLYPKDMYVLTAKSRPIRENIKKQSHARKYHCYFLVFKKARRNVGYRSELLQTRLKR